MNQKEFAFINEGFDPYQAMLQKKPTVLSDSSPKWPEIEIKALEIFCRKHGIDNFKCGNMSPSAAITFLKKKLGISDELTETSPNPYGPKCSYESVIQKKNILFG